MSELTKTSPNGLASGPERKRDAAQVKGIMKLHPLLLILILGLIPRLALLVFFHDLPIRISDALDYDQLATSLAETGSYASANGIPISLRPPFYPVMVAGIYRMFGAHNLLAVHIFQIVLSLLTTVIVYKTGVEIYCRRVGVVAAAIICFYPTLLGFNHQILSEVLFTFFQSVIVLLTTLVIKRNLLTRLVMLGIVLGLGALTRSILWLFTPLLAAYMFLACGPGLWNRFRCAAIPMTCFLLTIAPWVYRNSKVQETLTFIDVMGGRNVMMGNYEFTPMERSWATVTDVTGDRVWHRVLAAANPGYRDLTQGQIDKLAMKYGIRFALSHPGLSLRRSLIKFFNFWQLERELIAGSMAGYFGPLSKPTILTTAILICGAYVTVIFGAIFGAILVPPTDVRVRWMLVLTIAFPCLLHSIAFAHSRYHLPLIPILAIYAAAAATSWRDVRRHRLFPLAAGVCLILLLSWVREFVMVDMVHFR